MASLDMGGDEADPKEPDADDEGTSDKDMHLSDAFDAIEKGDKPGFMESMRKCLLLSDEGAYADPAGAEE